MKRCSICREVKNRDLDFHKQSSRCKPCNSKYRKTLRQAGVGKKSTDYLVRYTYKTTRQVLEDLFELQDYRCGICSKDIIEEGYHVDHDHACCPGEKTCGKCIRGLLCPNCNRGLGQFKDSVKSLAAAIVYLESSK